MGGAGGAPPIASVCVAAASGAGAAAAPAPGSGEPQPGCESDPASYAYAFWDPCRGLEDRITDLLAQLTSAEKQTLLAGGAPAVPRLSLPGAGLGTEGLHGLAVSSDPTSSATLYLTSTQFPQAFGLGESWDPGALQTVGATTGYEARVYNARGIAATGRGTGVVIRAPNVDLARDPRWGRTEESYGEDPFLIGALAKGYLTGLHGAHPRYLLAASTLKHFMANSNETTRITSSSNLDDRNLQEYYSASFRAAVREGHANGIMTAYNQINGVPAAVTPLLKSLVVGTWGFDGFFSTDGQSGTLLVTAQHYFPTVEQSLAAIIDNGTAVLLQTNAATTVASAYGMGLITDPDMDAALRPVLRTRFRLGDFDPPASVPYKAIRGTETPWNNPDSKARSLDVTHKTIVLLKNANHTLPLDRLAIGSVAVIGPRADSVVRDWYGGVPPYAVTPRQGIVGEGVTVRYAADDTDGAATAAAAASDVAVVFVGNHPTCGDPPPTWGTCPSPYEGREQVDRMYIALEPAQLALVQSVYAANPRTVVVLVSSFPQGIGWINDNVPAIVHVTNSSQELGSAVADVLFGDYNPAGRTTTTWYQSEADIPTAITDYDIKEGTTYWYFTGTPLYPFGYGLSYASFAYANLTVSAPSVSASATPGAAATVDVEVGVDVTNTSPVAGEEVVQLYVAYPNSTLGRPRQQLRGFRRVAVGVGETVHVTFELGAADLTYYDAAQSCFAVEAGAPVELQVGASSADIRLRTPLGVAN
jgi:beta-glucosidase